MSNLKALKDRIGAVKNTQKITSAMKMVAASKLKRAQDRAEQARPYSNKILEVITNLASAIDENSRPELLGGRRDSSGKEINNKVFLIVTGSDRGLCGGFNSSIIKASKIRLNELLTAGKEVKIVVVGKKPRDIIKNAYPDKIEKLLDAAQGKQVEYEEADTIGKLAISMFESGEVDSVEIVFSKFVNALVQEVTVQSLIPLAIQAPLAVEQSKPSLDKPDATSSYEYEPDEEAILRNLVPQNISVQIFKAFIENSASEQGARMTAMDNATKNAGEMIDKLSLLYNRSRQAAITTELTEIVAGAEALN